jgi:hypothetical protein
MPISDIISVQITAQSQSVSRQGFGTPLIAAYHTHYVDLVREYSRLSEMVDDGFTTAEGAYLAAQAIFSQNPKVKRVKVGRRALVHTQTVILTPSSNTDGIVYTVIISLGGGVEQTATYTVSTDTLPQVCDGIVAAINALTGDLASLTASTVGSTVQVVAGAAGNLYNYKPSASGGATLQFRDATVDPGIATDLAAIAVVDDDWYALVLDSNGEAEINAAAAYIETVRKIFVPNSADSLIKDSGTTTDVGSDLEGNQYARTGLLFNEEEGNLSYAGAAWIGKMLPTDPGKATWAYKTLAGITADDLTSTEVTNLNNKTVNHYTEIAGVSITRKGYSASGEFLDITIFIDWLTARIEERLYALLVNLPKLPYTDASVDLVKAEILAQLQQGIEVGGLASDPAPVVTAPLVADVDSADRADRILPDVFFQAQLAGAIHTMEIEGVLTV